MKRNKILWADDEIDLLKPHILFLEEKGYDVTPVISGQDAIDSCSEQTFDLIFLDENMPGLTGLETLVSIKEIDPAVPVIMVTKSEEESIMNQAIGNRIADYLIKPVNPNQLLLSIKKNLHKNDIITTATSESYQQEFGRIGMQINDSFTADDWAEVYKKLVYWEIELEENQAPMQEMLIMQKREANSAFGKFIRKNYMGWMADPASRPLMSPDLFKTKVFPLLDAGEKVFFILIDNFRFDQWRVVRSLLSDRFTVDEEMYYSILPTATQYARNAIFSGLMPAQIAQMFPDLWVDEESEEGKNTNEEPLIQTQIDRFRKRYDFSYHKVYESQYGERILNGLNDLLRNQLNVVVINFIDTGDRNTNTNLRYKTGRHMTCDSKYIFEINDPARAGLPSPHLSTRYVFATNAYFFAYPNNYNYYVPYYRGTFQHGGISMEEMMVPFITLQPK